MENREYSFKKKYGLGVLNGLKALKKEFKLTNLHFIKGMYKADGVEGKIIVNCETINFLDK